MKIHYFQFHVVKNLLFFCLVLLFTTIHAQNSRIQHTINSGWKFHKGDITGFPLQRDQVINWENVSIPHTWNIQDVNDDEKGYYRGISWYKRIVEIPSHYFSKNVFIHFEGANQEVEVFVNGTSVGEHKGGYTAFTLPISEYLNISDGNQKIELLIKVNNKYNEHIPTLTADFTFFGGIYRDVYLIATSDVHFDLVNYGSKGVFISTPNVSRRNAEVEVRSQLVNESDLPKSVTVVNTIEDRQGLVIKEQSQKLVLEEGQEKNVVQKINVVSPKLWSPDDPYLYSIKTEVYENDKLLDEVSSPLGIRWFEFDAEQGFFLNGKHLKLIGTNRHQDFQGLGNALPDDLHLNDVQLLKEMGGNFLRVAHYPHDPTVLETCDRLGILAAVEIPIVNRITESEAFARNSINMQVEMIRQNYNHPSVIIWAYMNEVLLRPRFEGNERRQQEYFKEVEKLAKELESITRSEDPYRYTMIPNHGDMSLYDRVGLTRIPMIVGWNLYQGWYSAGIDKFAEALDYHRERFPDKPLIVTEFGADADHRLRSFNPERFDMTVDYSNYYHQIYLNAIMKRDFVAGATVWNLADFSSETREDVVPHINNKGLLSLDREPKDVYFFYQSHLVQSPYIRIASRGWTKRNGIADKDSLFSVQPVEVYTNLNSATLIVNGENKSIKESENNVIKWEVPFKEGTNILEVVSEVSGKQYKDYMEVDFDLLPYNFNDDRIPFKNLSINLGTHQRIFADELTQKIWIPDQPYKKGSWGYVGGETYVMENNSRNSFGTDRNILGTDLDPVYQTQQIGINGYKLDVPNGTYDVILHFAEIEAKEDTELLAYNLATEEEQQRKVEEKIEKRVFSVDVNGHEVFSGLNLAKEFEPLRAVKRKVRVKAKNKKGINVRFRTFAGRAVLNGIEVKQIY